MPASNLLLTCFGSEVKHAFRAYSVPLVLLLAVVWWTRVDYYAAGVFYIFQIYCEFFRFLTSLYMFSFCLMNFHEVAPEFVKYYNQSYRVLSECVVMSFQTMRVCMKRFMIIGEARLTCTCTPLVIWREDMFKYIITNKNKPITK